ncbi:MAG: lipopolysaccharide heptosyltransferase II [Planctomycetaceae bacterium]|nr:lipopolysaccharide heptosyltransferase II [Planctomycetaceae bacterium]
MKISVYLPNWVGDAVMATPALRALRDRFVGAEVVAVLRPPMGDVVAGTGLVDRTITWAPRGSDANARGWRLIRRLRAERFDLAVLFPNSLRSGWLAWCSGAKRRVGFARNGRGILLTDGLTPKPKSTPNPVIDEYLRLVEHLGCTRLTRTMELATLPADEAALDAFWSRVASSPGRRPTNYICLNPGGAFGAAKHWPTTHFAELACRIATDLGKSVLVLCGPAERSEARQIAELANHSKVFSLADVSPSIGLTKAAIRRCDLLVTTDSGPRHFAAPFQVPVVTLFGPTHIAWSETFYDKSLHLQIPVDCGPCQQRSCPLTHHRCMTELAVDYVYASVLMQLEKQERADRAA